MKEDEGIKTAGGEESTHSKSGEKSRVIIFVCILLSVCVICFTLIYLSSDKRGENDTEGSIDVENEVQEGEVVAAKVAEGMFQMSMNTIWTFPSGDKPSQQAHVANVANNTRPFIIEVTIDETGEIIYTSPPVLVGTELESITLDTPLEKGEYETTCRYTLLNDDGSENGSFAVAVTVSVLN